MIRRLDIDRARGLAITLVVFGHIVARQYPAHVAWYPPLRRAIYGFHMPFFFYLSGLAAWIAGHPRTPPALWPALASARARRLLVPFAAMGMLIVLGKLAAARLIHVDNPPASLIGGIADLVWSPLRSPAYSLWYLAVLFLLGLMAPVLLFAARGRIWLVVAAFAALEFVPLPWHLYLAECGRYGLFFAAGLAAGSLGARWSGWIDRNRAKLLLLFGAGFVLTALYGHAVPFGLRLVAFGLVSMPALHALVRSPDLSSDRALATIGRYSMAIYLFNTIFIGLAKGVLLRLASWNGNHFVGFACALMGAGMLGPILLKRTLLRAIPVLDRMTG